MTLAAALSLYTALNVALVVGVFGLAALAPLRRYVSARNLLILHYCVAAGVVVAVLAVSFLPSADLYTPSATIWSAQSLEEPDGSTTSSLPALVNVGDTFNLDAGSVSRAWIATVLALLALGATRLWRDFRALRAILRASHRVRRVGRVSIWCNESIATPFTWWIPGNAHVVVPAYLAERGDQYRMAVSHELQHHRQRDTVWLYFFAALSYLCVLNPFAHLWRRTVSDQQEFACDESLLARHGWSVHDYARCLLGVATGGRDIAPRGALAFIRFGDPHVLTRRIEMMLSSKRWIPGRWPRLAVVAALVGLMTVAAYASGGWIQDRRVTLEQARSMAANVPATSFQVVVNDEVLHELNRYVGTPEGRAFMHTALQRHALQRDVVVASLARHGVPAEFAAVPLVESGYQNLDQSKNPVGGAGVWQIIPNTARNLGLRVDSQIDERLDAARSADAAARLLHALRLQFQNWDLALLAYNGGARHVQEAIDGAHSNEPWTLVRGGHEGDRGYLARVHAAMIVAANPQSVAP